jgi:hypothetical protein
VPRIHQHVDPQVTPARQCSFVHRCSSSVLPSTYRPPHAAV